KWTHVMPSRKQISLARELAKGEEAFLEAAKSLMVRRFSEVKELKAITMAAKDAMRNLSRPRRELASAINQAIRGRIARAAAEEARLVARALRTVGVDPQTLTFVKQEVAAVAGAASAAGKTEQAVGALSRVTQAAGKILRPLAPAAEVVAKVARPLGFLAVGVQGATAKTTEDYANAGVSALSTGLLEGPHPGAKAAGAGLAVG